MKPRLKIVLGVVLFLFSGIVFSSTAFSGECREFGKYELTRGVEFINIRCKNILGYYYRFELINKTGKNVKLDLGFNPEYAKRNYFTGPNSHLKPKSSLISLDTMSENPYTEKISVQFYNSYVDTHEKNKVHIKSGANGYGYYVSMKNYNAYAVDVTTNTENGQKTLAAYPNKGNVYWFDDPVGFSSFSVSEKQLKVNQLLYGENEVLNFYSDLNQAYGNTPKKQDPRTEQMDALIASLEKKGLKFKKMQTMAAVLMKATTETSDINRARKVVKNIFRFFKKHNATEDEIWAVFNSIDSMGSTWIHLTTFLNALVNVPDYELLKKNIIGKGYDYNVIPKRNLWVQSAFNPGFEEKQSGATILDFMVSRFFDGHGKHQDYYAKAFIALRKDGAKFANEIDPKYKVQQCFPVIKETFDEYKVSFDCFTPYGDYNCDGKAYCRDNAPIIVKKSEPAQLNKHKIIVLNAIKDKQYEKALEHIEILEKLSRELSLVFQYYKAKSYFELGKHSWAESALEKYLAKANSDDKYYNNAVEMLKQSQEFIAAFLKDQQEKYLAHEKAEKKKRDALEPEMVSNLLNNFVFVPGGCLKRGQPEAEALALIKKMGKARYNYHYKGNYPRHGVCVDGFWLSKYEVTQLQWYVITGKNPSEDKRCGRDCPVDQVSWDKVQSFLDTLKAKTGKTFRLPTEAEWEYAATSGGKNEFYAGGHSIDSFAWYDGNSGGKTHKVGTKTPNGLGIYDMSGNVQEWCQDIYSSDYYKSSPRNNPTGPVSHNPDTANSRAVRGGSASSKAEWCIVTDRGFGHEGSRQPTGIGLRLILVQD